MIGAVRIDRDAREAYLNMAGLMFQENRYGEAERFWGEALRINPVTKRRETTWAGFSWRAAGFPTPGGNSEGSRDRSPERGDLFNIARVYEVEGRAEEAAEYYEKALAASTCELGKRRCTSAASMPPRTLTAPGIGTTKPSPSTRTTPGCITGWPSFS